jgi:serine/threonine-protein kinase
MRKCPSCAHEIPPDARYCAYCATPADPSSAETVIIGNSAAGVRVSSDSSVDEGRFLPGTVVGGRYRIAGLLGRGGMGEVYRATDLTLGQAVALKFLPEATAKDERSLARFYNEVRIARQVTHPNVCRVYDVGQAEGQHYISMEFVDGEDLGTLLRRIGRLPVDKGVETARQLCAGLAAAHEKGVLHRDLKPANVMIDGRGKVIIMDFGLAGLAEHVASDVRSGTPAYMAPEQLAGTEVSPRSDIYALGLVLYEIFTGRRAFEASSMMELIEMQERAAPLSISSVARDLDPAVERVILRCLRPDPRQRPASARAVAAGLPGGDPLAAAMAAGETPSPELVAAAGEMEGLAPRVALTWLGAAVALLAVVVALVPRVCVTSRIALPNSPDALSFAARNFIRDFGYDTRPVDAEWSLAYDDDYSDWAPKHPREAMTRWDHAGSGQPSLVKFWYRESPQPMVAQRQFNTAVTRTDPPLEMSGMIRVETDPAGTLVSFDAVPMEVESTGQKPAPAFDFNRLLRAAGFDPAALQPAEPQWTPLVSWDARAAWNGTDSVTGAKLHFEAASWRGRPVYFHITGPWTPHNRMVTLSGGRNSVPVLILIYGALLAAVVLAWQNLRGSRADQRSALHLAAIYFACMAGANLLHAHHTATQNEIGTFWTAISAALLNSALTWIFYIALEPWVRRRWPRTMISWTRFTAKGTRDPLVGRDLLYGSAMGVLFAFLMAVAPLVHGNDGRPVFPPLDGLRAETVAILTSVPAAIFSALLFFFVLFLLRLVLRKEWIAGAAFVLIVGLAITFGTTTPVDYVFNGLAILIIAVALLRYGLLASIVATFVEQLLGIGGTLSFGAWYAGMAALPFILVLALALYGFRTSLGGRRWPGYTEEL